MRRRRNGSTLPAEQAQYANEVFNSSYNLGFLGVTKYLKYHNENCFLL